MSEKDNRKQLVVIGAGSGGYAAAFTAADIGMQVTLIDAESSLGGVCLHRGCIPTKALLHVAKVITDAAEAKNWGVEFTGPNIDVDKIRAWKNNVVKRLTLGLQQLAAARKIEFIEGEASFADSSTLEVKTKAGSTEEISFQNAILATGAHPAALPNIPADSPLVMDSAKALEVEDIPNTGSGKRVDRLPVVPADPEAPT